MNSDFVPIGTLFYPTVPHRHIKVDIALDCLGIGQTLEHDFWNETLQDSAPCLDIGGGLQLGVELVELLMYPPHTRGALIGRCRGFEDGGQVVSFLGFEFC